MKTCFCPDNTHLIIAETLNIIGKKWTFRIIERLVFGYTHFKDFLKINPNLSSKVLSDRLKELEELGIIKKKLKGSSPKYTEYYLTEKGKKLTVILFEVIKFSQETSPTLDPKSKIKSTIE